MTQDKIYVRTTKHGSKPILVWHPSGRGESFEELSIDEARELIQDLEKASGTIGGISFVSHETAINELQDKLEAIKAKITQLHECLGEYESHEWCGHCIIDTKCAQITMKVNELKAQIEEITTELSKHPKRTTYYRLTRVVEDYSILMANIQKILGVKEDGD